MKKIAFKTLSILLAAVLLVAALPIAAFAEDVSAASSHQHIFEVSEYVICEPFSNGNHLKTIFGVYTCILCGEVIIVEEDAYLESHEVEVSYSYFYSNYSNDYHVIEQHEVETCKWCGFENGYVIDSYYECHDIEVNYYKTYSVFSNENHLTIQNRDEICLCCGTIINSDIVDSWYDWHEFDDSVDPEVDMDGVCIHCGDEVFW